MLVRAQCCSAILLLHRESATDEADWVARYAKLLHKKNFGAPFPLPNLPREYQESCRKHPAIPVFCCRVVDSPIP